MVFQASKPAKASKDDEEMIQRWKDGETGIPLIDALMRELLTTGYISYRGRQHVASYFVHDLGLDWRVGADFFEAQLIDYDVCSNWGNWAMAAGLTGAPVSRFDTVAQAKGWDPDGRYVRFWLPELKTVPAPLIHEPWLMCEVTPPAMPAPLTRSLPPSLTPPP